jgi:hypothetical protein
MVGCAQGGDVFFSAHRHGLQIVAFAPIDRRLLVQSSGCKEGVNAFFHGLDQIPCFNNNPNQGFYSQRQEWQEYRRHNKYDRAMLKNI